MFLWIYMRCNSSNNNSNLKYKVSCSSVTKSSKKAHVQLGSNIPFKPNHNLQMNNQT